MKIEILLRCERCNGLLNGRQISKPGCASEKNTYMIDPCSKCGKATNAELLEACHVVKERLAAWADTADMRGREMTDPEKAQEQVNLRDNYGFLIHKLQTARDATK